MIKNYDEIKYCKNGYTDFCVSIAKLKIKIEHDAPLFNYHINVIDIANNIDKLNEMLVKKQKIENETWKIKQRHVKQISKAKSQRTKCRRERELVEEIYALFKNEGLI